MFVCFLDVSCRCVLVDCGCAAAMWVVFVDTATVCFCVCVCASGELLQRLLEDEGLCVSALKCPVTVSLYKDTAAAARVCSSKLQRHMKPLRSFFFNAVII